MKDKGLAVISVSVDYPEDQSEVLEFLQSKGATFDNVISQFGSDAKTADEFEMPGGVPFYQLFDRSGRLRYQFSEFPEDLENGEHLDQIDNRVKEILTATG
jgi:hypothetical protein